MKTILETILEQNPNALANSVSSVWNIYNTGFGNNSKCYKDAHQLSIEIASTHACDVDIYAITGAMGRSAHSKTEILLLAVKAGDDVDRCSRKIRKLI